MKKMFRVLVPGIFAALVLTVGSVSIFAQGDVCSNFEANQALYAEYTDNYQGTLEQKKKAVEAAKEYVAKYAACSDFEAQVTYLKKAGPSLAEKVKKEEAANAKKARLNRLDAAMKGTNKAEVFAAGSDVIQNDSEYAMDVAIVLASVGLDEAVKENDSFNDKTITYAQMAIDKLNSNTKSLTGDYGVKPYGYNYDTKENALGWMNYALGIVKYYRQKNKDEGLDYFYKSIQFDSETKDKAFIYTLIGDKYSNKVLELRDKIVATFEANENKETFESKSLEALLRGYLDRAIDAYAKAYQLNKKNNKTEIANNQFETLKTLYKVRYDSVDEPMTDEQVVAGLNTYVATNANKTLPNPNSEVKPVNPPVKEETPTDSSDSATTNDTAKKSDEKTNGNDPKN